MNNETIHRGILDIITKFVANHPNSAMERFKDNVANWGNHWADVGYGYLRAADHLTAALLSASKETHHLVAVFEKNKDRLLWEQSYVKGDNMVGDDMLAGYGFSEIIGKNGPFLSTRVRCGIGIWGANIAYPRHRHQAQEIYLIVAGSALFRIGDSAEKFCSVGDVIFINSMLPHEFRTKDDFLIVFYLWQAGDLREVSTFG